MAAVSFSATSVLLGGAAFAAPSISNTGPGSHNKITVKNVQKCTSKNNNNLGVLNVTAQKAKTGSASVKHNTTGGSATSGNAANTANATTTVDVTNNSACGDLEVLPVDTDGSIDTTGPGSWNKIEVKNVNKVKVVNNNNVGVGNVVLQGASSGNASVWGNTTGGSATSGSASNTSTTSNTITVSNN